MSYLTLSDLEYELADREAERSLAADLCDGMCCGCTDGLDKEIANLKERIAEYEPVIGSESHREVFESGV